jgi:toxin-antitoxin system PIN domain toxin
MILIDVNLLIYAYETGLPQHAKAKDWLDEVMAAPAPVGLPWQSILGFVRIVTHPGVFAMPKDSASAWAAMEKWLDADPVWIPGPTERHRQVFSNLLRRVRPSGNLVPDTHLAALAIEHGLTLMTVDRGFARFPGLRWENPIDQPPG